MKNLRIGKKHSAELCIGTLKLLGDYWTLRLIDALDSNNAKRFCELQRELDNLNPVTLTNRLKKLENAKLINRYESRDDKVAVSYGLNNYGRKALPVITALNKFAEQS